MHDLTRVPSPAPAVHRHHHALRRMRLAAFVAAAAGRTPLTWLADRTSADPQRNMRRAGQPDTITTFSGAVLG